MVVGSFQYRYSTLVMFFFFPHITRYSHRKWDKQFVYLLACTASLWRWKSSCKIYLRRYKVENAEEREIDEKRFPEIFLCRMRIWQLSAAPLFLSLESVFSRFAAPKSEIIFTLWWKENRLSLTSLVKVCILYAYITYIWSQRASFKANDENLR